jgi:hypothetical protein
MRFLSILGTMLCLTLFASACEFLEPPAGITKAVTAQSVQGATFEPVGITDNFAPGQNEFHVIVTLTNAPKNSSVQVVWTAVDVGSALAPNTKIAEIFWNGKLDRTLNFIVVGTPQKTGTVVVSKCPPATTQPHKPTGMLAQVIMAESAGANNEPVRRQSSRRLAERKARRVFFKSRWKLGSVRDER